MSEIEDSKDIDAKNPSRFESSKRFAFMALYLILFFLLFTQLVPRLIEDKQPEPPIEKPQGTDTKIEQPIAEQEQSLHQAVVNEGENRIRELEEKIVSLQEKYASEVAELKNKIEQNDLEAQNKASKVVSALVAFSQLKDAINSGKPYKTEIKQFMRMADKNPEIETIISELEKHSDSGIIILAKLKEEFSPLIDAALAKREQGYWRGVANKFIAIRKIGERAGDDDESILARAEIRLEKNDLRVALKELEALTPSANEVFSGWIADAENILKTEENLSKLQLLLIPTEAASQL